MADFESTLRQAARDMKEAAMTIDVLGQELERARNLCVKLEQTMIDLTEDEVIALARKLGGRAIQSEKEDIALITATNKIEARAQDIMFAEMTRSRKQDGKDR